MNQPLNVTNFLDSVNRLNNVLTNKLGTLYHPTTSSSDNNNTNDENVAVSLRQAVNKNKSLSVELRQQSLLVADLLESCLKRQGKIEQQQNQFQQQLTAASSSSSPTFGASSMKKVTSNYSNNGNDDEASNNSENNNNAPASSIILPPVVHFDIAKILHLTSSQKSENAPLLRVVEDNKKNMKSSSSAPSLSLPQIDFLLKNYFPQMEKSIHRLKSSANERTQRMKALKAKIEADMRSDEEDAKRQEILKLFKTVEGLIAARSMKEAAAMYLMAESMINAIPNAEMKKTIQGHFDIKMLEYQMKIGMETLQVARNNNTNNNNAASGNNNNNCNNGKNNQDDDDGDESEESDIEIDLDQVLEELD